VGSDLISDMLPPSAADYISEGCAARLLERAERDPTPKLRRQSVLLAQMRETMHDRDLWEAESITDVVYGYDDLL